MQALLLDVVKKHRPYFKVWRPFRAWRRSARKQAMQSRAQLVSTAGHAVHEATRVLYDKLQSTDTLPTRSRLWRCWCHSRAER
jgi:hypothetical protein